MHKSSFLLIILVCVLLVIIGYYSVSHSDLYKADFSKTWENSKSHTTVASLSGTEDVKILDKLTQMFKRGDISEDFLNESLDYLNHKKDFLPETIQLFKNIDVYNGLVSSGSEIREDGKFFDSNIIIKYFLSFSDIDSLKSFWAISDVVASYENYQFLKNPTDDPIVLRDRKENPLILEWKKTGKIPSTVAKNDYYLNFILSDVSRESFLSELNDIKPKDLKDFLKIHGMVLGFWFDIFYKDINTIITRPDFIEYALNNRIDYFYIDKSLLSGKDLCSNIINPDIKDLCKAHISGSDTNEKYLKILKEFFIHNSIYD